MSKGDINVAQPTLTMFLIRSPIFWFDLKSEKKLFLVVGAIA